MTGETSFQTWSWERNVFLLLKCQYSASSDLSHLDVTSACIQEDSSCCGVSLTSRRLAAIMARGAVMIVSHRAVREREHYRLPFFSCCHFGENTIIANEKVATPRVCEKASAAETLSLSNAHREKTELPLGVLGHSRMRWFYITGLPVIVRGNAISNQCPIRNNGFDSLCKFVCVLCRAGI